jgi:succinylglutamate desuccinylase
MTEIRNTQFDRTINVNRIIGHVKGSKPGPTVILVGGMHGNENSGVFALHQVINELQVAKTLIRGNIYALCGNMAALESGERYCKQDLNRMWTYEGIEALLEDNIDNENPEAHEFRDLYRVIQEILKTEVGPFYFMDLHTTSSESIPFVMVNDSLVNRKFTTQYPVPMILGIEEYLDGALLSYINDLGYVAFGYEAGQHDDLASLGNQIAFVYLSLVFTGVIDKEDVDYYHYYEQLAKTSINSRDIYEIVHRCKIDNGDDFLMKPGFVNFQKVQKGQLLAIRKQEKVAASYTGRIFMPLYQSQGRDGFFEIRKIKKVFLHLSEVLRHTKFDHILPFLPGIRWQSKKHDTMLVNLKIARFFTKPFLHLLGYRSKVLDKSHLIIRNRDAASREHEYEDAHWSN